MATNEPIQLFPDIDGDNPQITQIESLCMNCHENVSKTRTFQYEI
jgi:hypothetical protein